MNKFYRALSRNGNGRPFANLGPPVELDDPVLLGRSGARRANGSPPALPPRSRDHRLRFLLEGASRHAGLRSLMVVGCRSAAGATTTVALLGRALAEGDQRRVVLVDANLRAPALDLVFAVAGGDGLSTVLRAGSQGELPLRQTRYPNLWVLGAGPAAPSPEALLGSQAMERVLESLTSRFDFVVLDAAPVLVFPDACGLAARLDGIVLVVEADRTPVHDAQRAKRDLELAGGRLIGGALNREAQYAPRLLRGLLR